MSGTSSTAQAASAPAPQPSALPTSEQALVTFFETALAIPAVLAVARGAVAGFEKTADQLPNAGPASGTDELLMAQGAPGARKVVVMPADQFEAWIEAKVNAAIAKRLAPAGAAA